MSEFHSRYPVSVRWGAEHRGTASSADGLPALTLASPPPFGGPAGVWSPEHLFVLSAATCFITTFLAVASASKFQVGAIECSGVGTLEKGDDRRFQITRIVLRPRLTILSEDDRERAGRLIDKAEAACLISRSMRSEVTLESEVLVGEPSVVTVGLGK